MTAAATQRPALEVADVIRQNGDAFLQLCRRLLLVTNMAAVMPSTEEVSIEPAQPRCCPQCGGTRLIYRELEPAEPTPTTAPKDSS